MSRIFWDTNLFIYMFQRHPEFFKPAWTLHERMRQRGDELLTSVMTLGEIQVGPRRANDYLQANKYRDAIRLTSIIVPFTEEAADIYANIRENPAIKAPDAIQLSCAAAAGVEMFVTNDRGLERLQVPGIHFIAPLMRVPV